MFEFPVYQSVTYIIFMLSIMSMRQELIAIPFVTCGVYGNSFEPYYAPKVMSKNVYDLR